MTHRDVIKALLNKELPDRVGLHEHFWPYMIENAWGEQGFEKGVNFTEHFDLDIQGVSWFSAPGPRPDLTEVVEESDEWIVRKDAWGASIKTWKHKAGAPVHIDFSVTSPDVWNKDYREAFMAIDVRDHVNLDEVRSTYKDDLCFMGNINVHVLETSDRDRIREECLGKLNGMKEMRAPNIYMSDHSVPPSVKLDDYRYMLELYHENCTY